MIWDKRFKQLHERCASIEEYAVNTKKELHKVLLKKMDVADLVECEVCGCLLWKCTAVKGSSEVRRKEWYPIWLGCTDDEYIYRPYYCKIHAPKEEEKEEDK